MASDLVGSTVAQPAAATDAAGQARGTVRSAVAGEANVTVRLDTVAAAPLPATAKVTFVEALPQLSMAASPNRAVANAADFVRLAVRGAPGAGPLVFSGLEDRDKLTPKTGYLDANGTFAAELRAERAGARTLTVTSEGTAASANGLFVAGPADPTRSIMRLSAAVGAGDGNDAVQIEVALFDAFGNPTPNEPVLLRDAAGQGNTLIYPLSGVTNGDGVFVAHVVSATLGTVHVQADAGGAIVAQAVTFIPGPMAAVSSMLLAQPDTVVVDAAAAVTLRLQARDAAGHPVPNRAVAFALPAGIDGNVTLQPTTATTDGNGLATTTLQTVRAGSYVVRASVGSAQVSTTARFLPGPLDPNGCTLTASTVTPAVGDANSGALLRLALVDRFGNPVANQNVVFSTSGQAPAWHGVMAATDARGQATARLATTLAGPQTITATAAGLSQTLALTFLPGAADLAGLQLTWPPVAVVADGNEVLALGGTVADRYGNPLGGHAFSLQSTAGGDVLAPTAGFTAADGTFAAELRGTRAGSRNVTLQAGPASLTVVPTLIAGPLALAHSSLTVSPNVVVADDVSQTTFTVVARDAFDNLLPNLGVWPSLSASNATFVPASGVTDGNATFVGRLRGQVAGSQLLRTTLGSGGDYLQATVRFVAGPATSATSTLTASPNVVAADGQASARLRLQLQDALHNPVAGVAVQFGAGGAGGQLLAAAPTTDATGTATADVASPVAGPRTASATAANFTLQVPLNFLPTAADEASSMLTLSPNRLVADGNSTTAINVCVRDAQNNLLTGAAVGLSVTGTANVLGASSGTTDGAGCFSTTLRSTVAEAKQVTANLPNGKHLQRTALFLPGEPNATRTTLTVTPDNAEAGDAISVRAVVRDQFNNAIAGVPVAFASDDNQASFSPAEGTSATNGSISATYVTTQVGDKVLSATVGGIVVTAPATFVANAGGQLATTFVASPNQQVADNASPMALTLRAVDSFGNPLAGAAVTLSTDNVDGNDLLSPATGTLNGAGVFNATLTSNKAGPRQVHFTAGDANGLLNVVFVAGEPNADRSALTAAPASVVANAVDAATLTAVLRDAFGNPVPQAAVALSSTGTRNTFAATDGNTDAAGTYVTTLQSATAEQKLISATLAGGGLLQASATFVPGPASAANTTLTAATASLVADDVSTVALTVQAADAQGNPIPAAAVTLVTDGNAVIAQPNGLTDADGAYVTYARSRKARTEIFRAGVAALTPVEGPQQSVIFRAGSPNATTSTVAAAAGTVADGASLAPVTVTVRDVFANLVPGVSLSLSLSGDANRTMLTQTNGTSDAAGQFVTSATSTLAGIVPVTVNAGAASFTGNLVFVAGPAVVAKSSLAAAPNSIVANNVASSTLTARLADAYGNAAGGVSLTPRSQDANDTFSPAAGTSDAGGVWTTALRTRTAGSKIVTAAVSDGNLTVALQATAGSPNAATTTVVASPNVQVAGDANGIVVVAVVRDKFANPVPSQATSLQTDNGDGTDTITALAATTDASGTARYRVTATRAGVRTLTLTAGSAAVTTTVRFVAATPVLAQTTFVASPNQAVADGTAAVAAQVTLRDTYGNPTPDMTVAFSATGGATDVLPASAQSDALGRASVIVRSTVAEAKTIMASVAGAGLFLTADATFLPGPAAANFATLAASPNSFVADDVATTTLTVTARDAYGNLVPATPVSLAANGVANTFAAANGNTATDGSYTTSLRSQSAGNKTVVATFAATGANVTTQVLAKAGEPNGMLSTVVASPNQQVADGVAQILLQGTVRDQFGNLVANQNVTWSTSSVANSDVFNPNVGVTDANGNVTSALRSTRAESKIVTLTANAATPSVVLSFVAGSPNAAASRILPAPDFQVADGNQAMGLVALTTDAFGNPVGGIDVTWAATGQNLTFTPTTVQSATDGRTPAVPLRSTRAGSKSTTATLAQSGTSLGQVTQNVTFVGGAAVDGKLPCRWPTPTVASSMATPT